MKQIPLISWKGVLNNPPKYIQPNTLPTYRDAIRDVESSIEIHNNDTIIGLDIETTGLRHWNNEIKLVQMYGVSIQQTVNTTLPNR